MSRRTFGRIINKAYSYCVVCESDKDLGLDHIYPKSLGGISHRINYQVLCQTCNVKKANMLPKYWAPNNLTKELAGFSTKYHEEYSAPTRRALNEAHACSICRNNLLTHVMPTYSLLAFKLNRLNNMCHVCNTTDYDRLCLFRPSTLEPKNP